MSFYTMFHLWLNGPLPHESLSTPPCCTPLTLSQPIPVSVGTGTSLLNSVNKQAKSSNILKRVIIYFSSLRKAKMCILKCLFILFLCMVVSSDVREGAVL